MRVRCRCWTAALGPTFFLGRSLAGALVKRRSRRAERIREAAGALAGRRAERKRRAERALGGRECRRWAGRSRAAVRAA